MENGKKGRKTLPAMNRKACKNHPIELNSFIEVVKAVLLALSRLMQIQSRYPTSLAQSNNSPANRDIVTDAPFGPNQNYYEVVV